MTTKERRATSARRDDEARLRRRVHDVRSTSCYEQLAEQAPRSKLGELLGALLRQRDSQGLLFVIVKIAGIAWSLAARYERRLYSFLEDGYPVGAGEPLVALDVVHARLEVAVPLGEVNLEQVAQQILQVRAKMRGEAWLAAHDLLVDLDRLIGEEWWISCCHLVDQNAQCPPVHRLVVALAEDDLGRQIFRCAAQGPRPTLHPLGEAKVGDLQVTLRVDQEILRLQIPVDQIEVVKVLEREYNLSRVKTRVRLREAADLAKMAEHLATGYIFQHHVQIRVVLEVEAQRYEERETDRLQYPLLVERVLHLLQLDDLLFIEYLHGVILLGRFVLDDHHASKRAGAQSLDALKVVETSGVGRILLPFVLKLLLRLVEELFDALGGIDLLVGSRGIVAHLSRAGARACQGSSTGLEIIQRTATSSSAYVRVR